MKKCIIIPDSFKGTLSSVQVCTIIKEEVEKQFSNCECVALPVADGGEGTVDSFLYAMPEGEKVTLEVEGPYSEPVEAYYGRFGDLACIEMAAAAGLPLVGNRLDPSNTTTFGVGLLIRHALDHGAKRIVLGLGGSATNDGGCGCAAALGAIFKDKDGNSIIPVGRTLSDVVDIDLSAIRKRLEAIDITAMVDVQNPLIGLDGAAHIYGPQKGADPEMVRVLDDNLRHLDGILQAKLGMESLANTPGAGAAGGFGAGVLAFLGGTLCSGIETVLDVVAFDEQIADADVIFTGEGRLDEQSLSGKVISGVASHASKQNVPVVAVVGSVGDHIDAIYDRGVSAVFSINRTAEAFEVARTRSERNVRETIADILRLMRIRLT